MPNARLEAETAVLDAIKSVESRPYGASRRELAEMTGIGLGTVQGVVTSLAAAGIINYTEGIARSISIKIGAT